MLIDNLSQYLINQGICTAEGTDLFIGKFPDADGNTYDNAVMLLDTGGIEPNKYVPIRQLKIQVTVRNTDYATGYAKMKAIRDALHRKGDDVVLEAGGVDLMMCFALQEPTFLGRDESERSLFICNFVFKLRND